MKSFKKIVTKNIYTKNEIIKGATNLIFVALVFPLFGCQSSGGKDNVDIKKPLDLSAQSVSGSESNSYYETKSNVVVSDQGKVTKKYVSQAKFEIDRTTLHVNEKGDIQFRTVTKNKTGDLTLKDLAYLEPGEELLEMIDKYGKPLVVKDIPLGSIFYIPRVTLPKNPVNVGDTWIYKGRWISIDTGLPFELTVNSKLKSWSDCDGLLCAIITFTGEVSLPADFPLKSTLKSEIKGVFHYSPVSYEVLWGESFSEEEFYIEPIQKLIKVDSRSCSYKIGYNKKC